MENENVALREGFTQVCVWRGTTMGDQTVSAFEEFVLTELGARAQFLECVITRPDRNGPGGRSDLLFAVANEDLASMAIPMRGYGISWIEDVVSTVNNGQRLYPARVLEYCSWPTSSGTMLSPIMPGECDYGFDEEEDEYDDDDDGYDF